MRKPGRRVRHLSSPGECSRVRTYAISGKANVKAKASRWAREQKRAQANANTTAEKAREQKRTRTRNRAIIILTLFGILAIAGLTWVRSIVRCCTQLPCTRHWGKARASRRTTCPDGASPCASGETQCEVGHIYSKTRQSNSSWRNIFGPRKLQRRSGESMPHRNLPRARGPLAPAIGDMQRHRR